jgi:hypothetical protein
MSKRFIAPGLLALAFGAFGTAASGAGEQQLDGHWEGAITQPAGDLKIAADLRTRGDAVSGTFDLPAAAVFRWPLKIGYASLNVNFRLPNDMSFEGELRGDMISGKMHNHCQRRSADPSVFRHDKRCGAGAMATPQRF